MLEMKRIENSLVNKVLNSHITFSQFITFNKLDEIVCDNSNPAQPAASIPLHTQPTPFNTIAHFIRLNRKHSGVP